MTRRSHILTAAALLAVCATPASAATYEDLHSSASTGSTASSGEVAPPPSSMAAGAAEEYAQLRGPDAAQGVQSAGIPAQSQPGPYTDSQRNLVESPEVQQMQDRIRSEIRPVVEVPSSSGGFDWGDAGIGAAGMLALFSIAGGSALLLTSRRRRVAAH
jgi:hypothetical protein